MPKHSARVAVMTAVLLFAAGWVGVYYEGAGGEMSQAAERFLGALSPEQRNKTVMPFDDPKRTDWHYIPKPERKGMQIKEMNADQRRLAHALLHTGLSEVGYEKATTIMSLEAILHDLEKSRTGGPIRDPDRYYFTIFGQPGPRGKWGWSVEGHHLSLNFTIDDGRLVSATPAFFGVNPAIIKSEVAVGPRKGTRTLASEEVLAFELLGSLGPDQRKTAVVGDKAPDDLRGATQAQAAKTPPLGISSQMLTESQNKTLWSLVESYAKNMPAEVGDAWLAEIKKAGTDKIHFAWWGADKPGVGHYYRLQGPTFLVEFINVQADSAGNPANHIHSVWRNLAGDFGVAAG